VGQIGSIKRAPIEECTREIGAIQNGIGQIYPFHMKGTQISPRESGARQICRWTNQIP
jgi:hypothetical protein